MSKWLMTVLFLAGSAFLTRLIPFSSFFRNLDTMIHEFGHAAVTLLTSGRVLRIELNPDHSGVTYSTLSTTWSVFLVALSGYVIASLFSLLMFYLYHKRNYKLGLVLMTLIAIAMLALFVHRGFGVLWLTGFIALNAIVYFLGETATKYYYLALAFLTLEESVVGPLFLIVHAIASPGEAGDAANLARLTLVPPLVWALIFSLFSLWCAKEALGLFLGRRRLRARGRTPEPRYPESRYYDGRR
jgi:hypothetical protein